MIRRAHAARWLALLVIAGLLAMHGAAGEHGLVGTGMPTMPMTAAMPTAPHTVDVHGAQQAAVAVASMMSHTGQMCVALPVLLLLLLTALAATLVRRRQRLLASRSGRWARTARAPPCPPPQVRGVCLT